jgi:hypothetical protein
VPLGVHLLLCLLLIVSSLLVSTPYFCSLCQQVKRHTRIGVHNCNDKVSTVYRAGLVNCVSFISCNGNQLDSVLIVFVD